MTVFSSRAFDKHEQVVFCNDPDTGLRAIIAVHSTALGPAVGGCRFWDYLSAHAHAPADVAEARADEDAIFDVLRLSRGMSYKNAMAGLRLGGGKAVIMGDPAHLASPALFHAFGRHIQRLSGTYLTAEDVGTSPAFMTEIAKTTDYVTGLEDGEFATGDPSPQTAIGVFHGIKAAVGYKLGRSDLAGVRVAIQGVGHVGGGVARHLHEAGATLIVADVNQRNIGRLTADVPADVVSPQAIHTVDAEVFAPCALGGGINDRTIPQIKAQVIAGAANNQLENERVHGEALRRRGILYAPDYVINAGGIISVETEALKEPLDEAARHAKVTNIANTLREVFQKADAEDRPTGLVANEIAERRIADARQSRVEAAE
ncbi:leucine dehydrogenase [Rhodothalassium salexigens DSM 2132]|uniref:Leucine dehydrogenase n=1 Tax=Rhodothalassium salexigens DSM 2132 TaxID=1188247 RepID=A0A4R2PVE6_RHOSA|nr:Glu/Leu/Phe/Val dehydrogenase dimerization domain-containing protein [Rhodothalassium salexigens]MBB4210000.1 leucine dehydrogenase [Rhodothalassium salexigens DSM 2132]MBK1637628.1 amino acid dehydrogenase [Rhodothalassium salexigens DSM 2132]TCP38165.1 leucine dehydrogenase [Rhodothalassium salexigens DSM 2132]